MSPDLAAPLAIIAAGTIALIAEIEGAKALAGAVRRLLERAQDHASNNSLKD